jgi:hypothetical protein
MAASICWVVAESDTQLTIFDLSALEKQLPYLWGNAFDQKFQRIEAAFFIQIDINQLTERYRWNSYASG